MEALMTAAEVASVFKMNEQSIRRWVSLREIPYFKIGKLVRFRRSEIETWLENRKAGRRGRKNENCGGEGVCCGKAQGGLFAGTEAAETGAGTQGGENEKRAGDEK